MHTTTFTSVVSASLSLIALAHAAPFPAPAWKECSAGRFYTECQATGWAGCCTIDACSRSWCPDYPEGVLPDGQVVKVPEKSREPTKMDQPPSHAFCPRIIGLTQAEYHCYNNGFNGYCSSDPCALNWCPDYTQNTCTFIKENPAKPSNGNPDWYLCASNGFRGYCSVKACDLPWCPDYEYNTNKPVTNPTLGENNAARI